MNLAPNAPIPVPEVSPEARSWLYLAAWITGTLGQGTALVWGILAAATEAVSMPLWLAIASPVLAFITTQLHALSGRHVPSVQDVRDGEAPAPAVRRPRRGHNR